MWIGNRPHTYHPRLFVADGTDDSLGMSTIYHLGDDGRLVAMHETPYDSESLLQTLLAEHPSLLAGEQIDAAAPRRWLLVRREAGVPGEEGGSSRWAVDHLFLDQDGVPTLIEVKRSSDTRIRREVIGQMLDYAANAVVYWPVESIRASFESRCRNDALDGDELLRELVPDLLEAERFWSTVKTNLQAGRVRLVFVADVIPPELARVVEFLNQQMDPAEVLAVEVRQFVDPDGGRRTLVPRVLGQTARAQQQKSAGGSRRWDEPSFFAELERRSPDCVAVARRLIDWARARELDIWWGKGERMGSFFPMLRVAGTQHWTFSVWTTGTVEIQFQMMRERPPFDSEQERLALLRRLNDIEGVDLPEDAIGRRPNIPLPSLARPGCLDPFVRIFDEYLTRIRERSQLP